MRNIITLLLLVLITMLVALPRPAYAQEKTPSARLAVFAANYNSTTITEHRIEILHNYLKEHNSPLSESARTFVTEAEANGLDWKFVAAISGVESSFGLQIPANSYNGWGFGVYGNNVLRFNSWDDAITVISHTLKTRYVDSGATNVYSIGRIYAADPNWASKVQHFINDISLYEKNYTDKRLSISI